MKTRKIPIDQLRAGMFIHELDIPWIKSPFLKHRRLVKSHQDVSLLSKAGVRHLVIDLTRGEDVQPGQKPGGATRQGGSGKRNSDAARPTVAEIPPQSGEQTKQGSPPPVGDLGEELKIARLLQSRIGNLIEDLNNQVKQGRPLSVEQISPIIEEARESLGRNDQALLTMLHLRRQDVRLSDHGFGVFSLVLPLAMQLGCSDGEIEDLGMAALLHDSGWSRLPVHLLGKRKPYTGAELKLVHQHPLIAEDALKKSGGFSASVMQLVRQHHESAEGSGYPDRLDRQQVHGLLGILQVADTYDEQVHGLTDRPGMLPAHALKLIYQAAKKGLYSETIVSALIHVMGIYPLTSAVRLSSGEKGIVIEIDKRKPLLPRIRVVYQENGEPCEVERVIDLAAEQDAELKIVEVIDPIDRVEDPLGLLSVSEV